MSDFPTSYDTSPAAHYDPGPAVSPIGPQREYPKSMGGMMRIAEMVLCLLAFICASVKMEWAAYGGGWAMFVTMSALIIVLLLFLLTFLNAKGRIPIPWPIVEFIFYAVYSLFLIIASAVATARGGFHSSIIATSIFCWAATAVFLVETFFNYRTWRSARNESHHQTSATVTTTTTYTTNDQY